MPTGLVYLENDQMQCTYCHTLPILIDNLNEESEQPP